MMVVVRMAWMDYEADWTTMHRLLRGNLCVAPAMCEQDGCIPTATSKATRTRRSILARTHPIGALEFVV